MLFIATSPVRRRHHQHESVGCQTSPSTGGSFSPEAFSGAVSEAPSKLASALRHAMVRDVRSGNNQTKKPFGRTTAGCRRSRRDRRPVAEAARATPASVLPPPRLADACSVGEEIGIVMKPIAEGQKKG